jgi:hypothetical protein
MADMHVVLDALQLHQQVALVISRKIALPFVQDEYPATPTELASQSDLFVHPLQMVMFPNFDFFAFCVS